MAAPLSSMTGFARSDGTIEGLAWAWEVRSVNGRGLDLRFRLPPGFDALEPALRTAAAKLLKRGNVTANLTVKREDQPKLAPDPAALEQVLALALELAARIPGAEPPRAEALLGLPGVLRPTTAADSEAVVQTQAEAIRQGFAAVLDGLVTARQGEGARLAGILDALLAEIDALRGRAAVEAADQPAQQRARMLETVQALLSEVPALPEERIVQEVAMLAAKSDVREELDRLDAHVHAARALLAEGENIGRRFDFLVQEFNREANTLCSKSASVALTATGLKLKATIEQLREQVQNIE
ncbi:YicC/YloC family endoribonuclease [Limobrevibacterium gyesilva]|uniref:YicC family protein n=1 Tax=Limobrevibacterium gyesilva TaxID=2991712 RepID=A0AA41YJ42_9PROT|nr:YicC/YloC family endoribonuclease [Limobrevibacterium gyesilva]MCW3473141.1 YicC family protein [Limobrevibacterium gyesilva]